MEMYRDVAGNSRGQRSSPALPRPDQFESPLASFRGVRPNFLARSSVRGMAWRSKAAEALQEALSVESTREWTPLQSSGEVMLGGERRRVFSVCFPKIRPPVSHLMHQTFTEGLPPDFQCFDMIVGVFLFVREAGDVWIMCLGGRQGGAMLAATVLRRGTGCNRGFHQGVATEALVHFAGLWSIAILPRMPGAFGRHSRAGRSGTSGLERNTQTRRASYPVEWTPQTYRFRLDYIAYRFCLLYLYSKKHHYTLFPPGEDPQPLNGGYFRPL